MGEMEREERSRLFNEECLNAHNAYRLKHGAQALQLRKFLQKMAERAAKYMASTDELNHASPENTLNCDLGENIAVKFAPQFTDFTGTDFTDLWYKEILVHDASQLKVQPESINFMQIIWKATRYCGFGVAVSHTSKKVYAVGYYKPPLSLAEKNYVLNGYIPNIEHDLFDIKGFGVPYTGFHKQKHLRTHKKQRLSMNKSLVDKDVPAVHTEKLLYCNVSVTQKKNIVGNLYRKEKQGFGQPGMFMTMQNDYGSLSFKQGYEGERESVYTNNETLKMKTQIA